MRALAREAAQVHWRRVVCARVSSGSSQKIGGEMGPAFEEVFLQNAVRDRVLGAHHNAAELQNKYKKEAEEGGAVAEGSPPLAGSSAHLL